MRIFMFSAVTSLLPSRYPSLEVSSGAISSLHESFGGIAEALAGSATLEPHWGSRAIAEAVNALAGSATSGFYESLGQIAALLPQA